MVVRRVLLTNIADKCVQAGLINIEHKLLVDAMGSVCQQMVLVITYLSFKREVLVGLRDR